MDNTLSRALFAAADVFRSTGVRDYPKLLMGLIFLKFINDNQGEDSSITVPDEARWNTLTAFTEREVTEGLAVAKLAIERHRDNIEIRDVVGSLDFSRLAKHPKALLNVLKALSQVNLSNLDWAEADSTLNAIVSLYGHSAGTFYTPTALSKLLVELANPTDGTIYDPACGTGGLLLQAYAYAKEKGATNVELFGQELNDESIITAKVNAFIHGVEQLEIATGDTLKNPRFTTNGSLTQFDYVLSNPPLGFRLGGNEARELERDPFNRFTEVPRGSADSLWLQHIAASLNTSGRAAVLVPAGILFRDSDATVRKRLLEEDLLEAVISLPRRVLPSTGVPTAVVLLNKNKPDAVLNKVLFILAESFEVSRGSRGKPSEVVVDDELLQRIVGTVRIHKEWPQFSKLVTTSSLVDDVNLNPAKHIDLVNRESLLGGSVTWRPLEEIASLVTLGNRELANADEGGTPVVKGRNLSAPFINIDELDRVDVEDSRNELVTAETGDLLFQRLGQTPSVYVVDALLSGAIVHDTVYLVRLSEDYRTLNYFIADFVNSHVGNALLAGFTKTAGAPTLNLGALKKLSIPIPEKSVQQLVGDINVIERELFTRIEKAKDIRQRLFSIEDPVEAAKQLQSLGVEAQVLANSLLQLDDLSFQIRNTYPYPLAYAYRTLDAIPDLRGRYKAQLRVAENFLAFMGSLGLALVADLGLSDKLPSSDTLDDYVKDKWAGGISPGHWQELGRRSGEILRETEAHALGSRFADLWFKGKSKKESDFAKLTKKLVQLKNDDKHDRGPSIDADYLKFISELEGHLEQLYGEIGFLTQHPIRLVEDLDIDDFTGDAIVGTLVYAGDHPGLKQEEVLLSKPLPKGHLYIEKVEGEWTDLYPFLSVNTCMNCQTRETYMVDSWLKGRKVKLKSFERGHTKESNDQELDVGNEAQKVEVALSRWLRSNSA